MANNAFLRLAYIERFKGGFIHWIFTFYNPDAGWVLYSVNESSVRKWIKREKIPLQPTIDAIHRWLVSKAGF